jgi:hypothetical protein
MWPASRSSPPDARRRERSALEGAELVALGIGEDPPLPVWRWAAQDLRPGRDEVIDGGVEQRDISGSVPSALGSGTGLNSTARTWPATPLSHTNGRTGWWCTVAGALGPPRGAGVGVDHRQAPRRVGPAWFRAAGTRRTPRHQVLSTCHGRPGSADGLSAKRGGAGRIGPAVHNAPGLAGDARHGIDPDHPLDARPPAGSA